MNAIPTLYNGVQFRSRLEARWAAFFDLVQWKWEYEPYDLAGWIPDFSLRFWSVDPFEFTEEPLPEVIVEVKPNVSLDQFDVKKYRTCLRTFGRPVALAYVGATIHELFGPRAPYDGWGTIGWLETSIGNPEHFLLHDNATYPEVVDFWREAGNRVQWKAPR